MAQIKRIALPVRGIDDLRAEARAEGYKFIETLANDWARGVNRFDGPGEAFFGCFDEGKLVAVGGLNIDPFAGDPQVGRIRRVYVRPRWRNKGVGAALVTALVEEARKSFECVRLRAESADAARLYERLGFAPIANPDATHRLAFDAR
jgi:GNAT superfamily N-acetyltransferase